MREAISDWLSGVEARREQVASIHVDELDEHLSEPAQWVSGMLECLRAAESLVRQDGRTFRVAVSLPLARPVGVEEIAGLSLVRLVEFRTYTPPLLCVFEPGREPWIVTERECGGRCIRVPHTDLEMYSCEWWDSDDEKPAGGVWMRSLGAR